MATVAARAARDPGADLGTTIRLCVSSTFSDFRRERDLLQQRVFPDLREVCRAEGFRFLPIDLRWGVSEQAGSAQRTLPIIFEELRRSRDESPDFYFLLLSGDRYYHLYESATATTVLLTTLAMIVVVPSAIALTGA